MALTALVRARVERRPVAIARAVVGLAALARTPDARSVLSRLRSPDVVHSPYVELWGYQPHLPPALLMPFLGFWALAALLFAAGVRPLVSGFVLAACLAFVIVLDEQTYSNHLYLLALLVSLLALARGGAERDAPAWPVFLLKCEVSIVYFFAALAKINASYLTGAALAASTPRWLVVAMPPGAAMPLVRATSSAILLAEVFLAFALWSPRLRAAAAGVGVAMHAGMVLASLPGIRLQIAIFAAEMLALYPLFWARATRVQPPDARV